MAFVSQYFVRRVDEWEFNVQSTCSPQDSITGCNNFFASNGPKLMIINTLLKGSQGCFHYVCVFFVQALGFSFNVICKLEEL